MPDLRNGGVVVTLVFECACSEVFREDKYPEPYRYDTYRDVVNAHRERCPKAAGLSDANVSRPVRPAADETPTPSVLSSAANQSSLGDRLVGGFFLFLAAPAYAAAWISNIVERGLR